MPGGAISQSQSRPPRKVAAAQALPCFTRTRSARVRTARRRQRPITHLGDQAHLVHGRYPGAAADVQLREHRQPQQRGHRVMRQPRSTPQAQPELLQLQPRLAACKPLPHTQPSRKITRQPGSSGAVPALLGQALDAGGSTVLQPVASRHSAADLAARTGASAGTRRPPGP